ncbi:MAG: hypothetical protein ACLQJ7_06805 [Syntrophobacteraceae bacterium]
MSKTSGLLLTLVLVVFSLTAPVQAADFEGEWVGHWRNSLGEEGPDSLSLHWHDGGLRGIWTDGVTLWGPQTGKNTIHLRGKRDNGTTYDCAADIEHGEMALHYYATRVNGSTYEGRSELHRSN